MKPGACAAFYPGCGGSVCDNAPETSDDNGVRCCCFTGGLDDYNGNVVCSEDQSNFCQGSFCSGVSAVKAPSAVLRGAAAEPEVDAK